MNNSKKIVLMGGGGHAQELLNILFELNKKVDCISAPEIMITDKMESMIIEKTEIFDTHKYDNITCELINGIGFIPNSSRRRELWLEFKAQGYNFAQILSGSSYISKFSQLSEGCQILNKAVINSNVYVGQNTIINSGAIIEHDCVIGRDCHIAPGAILCGGVKIADEVFVGAGSIILPQTTIQNKKIIPAGSTVS